MEADQFISLPRKRYFADYIVDLIGQGVESRDDLRARCFEAGLTEGEAQSVFDPWGGTIRYLAETGVICYRVQEKKAFRLCPPFEPLPKEQAELELVRRYFTHFGPATVRDAAYFFGVSQTRVRAWVRQLPLREMEAEGIRCYAMGGEEDVPDIPEVLFLPGFDQLMLGYQKRESLFFRQEHLRGIFNLAGIVMPVVLFRGIVVGKWKLQGRRLALTLFEKLRKNPSSSFGMRQEEHLAALAGFMYRSDSSSNIREYTKIEQFMQENLKEDTAFLSLNN